MGNTISERVRDQNQIIVTGVLRQKEKNDLITFTIPLGFVKIICIVTVPAEGTMSAPVYVKFRLGEGQ